MTPGRPAARPAGLYIHRPRPVHAMGWTGDRADLPDLCSYFNRVLEVVDMPGLGACIPLVTRCGTVYATPGDVVVQTADGHLAPVPDRDFATDYRLKEEQPR